MLAIIKEPFIQFLAIGTLVFLLHASFSGNETKGEGVNTVTINQDVKDFLHTQTEDALMANDIEAEPESQEYQQAFAKVKQTFIRNQVFFLEGVANGLDKNDPVIKDRVIAKVEVLAAEGASTAEITDETLENYYINNLPAFSWSKQVDLWQVFFDKSMRPNTFEQDCNALWQAIKSDQDIDHNTLVQSADQSQKFRLDMPYMQKDQLIQLYGADLAASILNKAGPGWMEPAISDEGCHLIKVVAIRPGGRHPFENVKKEIANLLEAERNQKALDDYYEQIKNKYSVVEQ